MGSDVWSGIMGIAMALIALAFFTLVINKSGETSNVIHSAGSTFGNLLGIVTLQNGGFGGMMTGNSFSSGLIN
jgi:hypothetical protein